MKLRPSSVLYDRPGICFHVEQTAVGVYTCSLQRALFQIISINLVS